MNGIKFIEPTQKMEFEQKEYLLANYDVANKFFEPREIPYFAFDFTLISGTTVWLQVINFDMNTGEFAFIDFAQLDNTKLFANYFESYTTSLDNIGLCRIAFKTVSGDVYKISYNLLSYTKETLPIPPIMIVTDGWIPFDVTNVTVENPNEIKFLNTDATRFAGVGLKINSIISHFVKSATYDGVDTTLILTGSGSVPLSIGDLKYKRESFAITAPYWWATLNNVNENSILGLEINGDEVFWSKMEATIVFAGNRNLDKGSNPNNGTYNFNINGNDLVSSDILLDTDFTDCGILLQNNIIKFHEEIKFKTIVATGSNDVGRGEIEIIAFV